MPTIVIVFNIILASCCLIFAWRLWRFRLSVKRSTQVLVLTEQMVHETLKDAPEQIAQGQFNLRQWNLFLEQLGTSIHQGKSILALMRQGQRLGIMAVTRSGRMSPLRLMKRSK